MDVTLNGTILVVDDLDACRRPMERLLEMEGYIPHGVSSGAEALRSLRSFKPSLILLDLSMPEMDGITFLQRLQDNPAWRSLPVIVISGESSPLPFEKAKELGARDFLIKTHFSPDQLFGSIRRSLESQNV